MLKSSRCSVTFPTNGLRLTGEITFQPGITAVVGRNGTGKTFRTIELWRYLLFGKKALRGPASDYKTLDAEGVVEIKGVDYLIKRSAKSEGLYQGDDQLAVGADAVNKKVVELLGFGLEVFDITNASVQKQSNKLTQLTPAKRKELIDEVCGLALNEKAEKDCKDKSKLLKLEADTIRDNLPPLIEPIEPEGYRPSRELSAELEAARLHNRKRSDLEREGCRGIAFDKPQDKPSLPRQDVEALEAHESLRLANLERRKTLQTLVNAIPPATLTQREVDDGLAWLHYDDELSRRGPKPVLSKFEVDTALATYAYLDALEKMDTEVSCPRCEYAFTPAQELPDVPEHDRQYYRQQELACVRWSVPIEQPQGERVARELLLPAKAALVKQTEREQLLHDIAAISILTDKSMELAQARALDSAWNQYEMQQELLRKDQERRERAAKELATLDPAIDVETMNNQFVAARIYESQLARYESDKAEHLEKMAKIRDLSTDSEDFNKGAKRLVEARREVKGFLAPSLSRIASMLITEMTCGKLTQVQVDEDMNVSVDGQDVATLSGAGETAANLALRLALGRTLVGGVFPVFLGDEIDADADEERSEATFECLRNLRGQFAQVIMITHKPHVLADHILDFDD